MITLIHVEMENADEAVRALFENEFLSKVKVSCFLPCDYLH